MKGTQRERLSLSLARSLALSLSLSRSLSIYIHIYTISQRGSDKPRTHIISLPIIQIHRAALV